MIEIGGGVALALILVLLWYNLNVLPYLFLGDSFTCCIG